VPAARALPPNQFSACKPCAPDFTSFPWILLAPIRFCSVIPLASRNAPPVFPSIWILLLPVEVKLLIVVVCVVLGFRG
jgi:hypothetical protein